MNEEKSSFIKGINEQRPTAYHQLYNEYYKALVLYAINFLSSQQAAEDIVQDLFATMWEKKMRFLSLPSFRTYLYNSIRNASLNYLKHQNVESKLPARCREIFLLHMDGKKNEEIATVLGISIETVKTQKKRAIQSIKEQMGTCYFLLPLCDILYSSKFFS